MERVFEWYVHQNGFKSGVSVKMIYIDVNASTKPACDSETILNMKQKLY